jgi:uncharacterized protein (DUF433 family)
LKTKRDKALELKTPPLPLKVDADGVVRVGGTRVTLDSVVVAFRNGATAEQIAQQFPTLDLSDVYSVIGYYLQSPADVETYLKARDDRAGRVKRENESKFPPDSLRSRLSARRR